MSLAEDLVTAAAEKIGNHVRPDVWAHEVAQLAVVAVLRALAAEECDWREEELAGLADEIEIRSALSEDIESERLGVPQAEKPQP